MSSQCFWMEVPLTFQEEVPFGWATTHTQSASVCFFHVCLRPGSGLSCSQQPELCPSILISDQVYLTFSPQQLPLLALQDGSSYTITSVLLVLDMRKSLFSPPFIYRSFSCEMRRVFPCIRKSISCSRDGRCLRLFQGHTWNLHLETSS